MNLLEQIGIGLPIIQAPMAGTSTPAMAAAVTDAGGLGSIAFGAVDAKGAEEMVRDLKARTDGPFNVNLFVHAAPSHDPGREQAWIEALTPLFHEYGAQPPTQLRAIYRSFVEPDDAMMAVLLEARPRVVSFHFGLPPAEKIAALKQAGFLLFSTATSLAEAGAARKAGIDALVGQGWEAGGHRGIFDPAGPDERLDTLSLTRLLAKEAGLPVIAAGGIMDGAGIAAALDAGAVAAQLGTAFVGCPESNADEGYRMALASDAAHHTVMVDAISGRPARCLGNRFTAWAEDNAALPRPGYPMVYDAGKALNAAAKAVGEYGFGAQWAGQGAPRSRPMPAAELVTLLARELEAARY
ncbi:MAG TPA: nitronate monooxygenase [Sphingobium sp.]|uniref:NAD(P)H-dependent flavin oxidoreductase n=1 Tax=Sphingobium sp. TaxID=1912891 RepID=UPI002ED4B637